MTKIQLFCKFDLNRKSDFKVLLVGGCEVLDVAEMQNDILFLFLPNYFFLLTGTAVKNSERRDIPMCCPVQLTGTV